MTTSFMIMRLIAAGGLFACAWLINYVGSLFAEKPSRRGAGMLQANSDLARKTNNLEECASHFASPSLAPPLSEASGSRQLSTRSF